MTTDATRRGKGARTAARILDAAEELFAEQGYEGTTVRQVAEVVGLREPSVYNHYPNKDGLYAAVLERALQPLLDELEAHLDMDTRPPSAVRITGLLAERPDAARLLQHETLTGGDELHPIVHGWITNMFDRAERAVANMPAAESLDRDDIALFVLAMHNLVVGYFASAALYKAIGDGDLESPEILDKQIQLLRRLTLLPASDGPCA